MRRVVPHECHSYAGEKAGLGKDKECSLHVMYPELSGRSNRVRKGYGGEEAIQRNKVMNQLNSACGATRLVTKAPVFVTKCATIENISDLFSTVLCIIYMDHEIRTGFS